MTHNVDTELFDVVTRGFLTSVERWQAAGATPEQVRGFWSQFFSFAGEYGGSRVDTRRSGDSGVFDGGFDCRGGVASSGCHGCCVRVDGSGVEPAVSACRFVSSFPDVGAGGGDATGGSLGFQCPKVRCAGVGLANTDRVSCPVESGHGSSEGNGVCANGGSKGLERERGFVFVPGKNWASNRRKRELRKQRSKVGGIASGVGEACAGSSGSSGDVPEWRRGASAGTGYCETVKSQTACPSYGQALSDAEKEAKESLAKRRAAENAVAQKLAELKLESLRDEKRCEQINDLKRQRLVEWTQVSAAKTQESLERLKAAGGIVVTDEQHAKVLRKVKDLEYEYDVLKERVKMAGHYDLLADLKAPGTATEAYEQAQAEMWAYGSVHSEPTGSDAAKIKERLEEFDRVYLETGQPPPFRPLDEDDDRPRDPVADIMRYRNKDNYGGPEFKW